MNNFQNSNQNYQHIADRMLRQLQQQYWEVHKYDKKQEQKNVDLSIQQTPEVEEKNDEDQNGYQCFDNDVQFQNNCIDSEDEDQNENNINTKAIKEQQSHNNYSDIQELNSLQNSKNPENIELVEVAPCPESTFEISETEEDKNKYLNIDQEKIISFTKNFDIQVPEWAHDQALVQQKIRKLFGSSQKFTSSQNR